MVLPYIVTWHKRDHFCQYVQQKSEGTFAILLEMSTMTQYINPFYWCKSYKIEIENAIHYSNLTEEFVNASIFSSLLWRASASILLDIGLILLILTFNVMNVRQTSAKAPRAIDLVDARTWKVWSDAEDGRFPDGQLGQQGLGDGTRAGSVRNC